MLQLLAVFATAGRFRSDRAVGFSQRAIQPQLPTATLYGVTIDSTIPPLPDGGTSNDSGMLAMGKMVNLNADIAEGWGAYDIGNDVELMKIIKSASVACGFHAGDANTMHRLCLLAKEQGVSVGAHPGFNDLWGFGRRRIQMKPADLEYMVAYQIGALQAMAAYAGLKVTHLKAHGALNNMAAEEEGYALAIGRAIKAVDRDIIYVVLSGSQMEKAAQKLELRMAREGFPDRKYDDAGNLAPRSIAGTVIKDPKVAAESALRMVQDGQVISMSGKPVKVQVETLCVHGDEATGVMVGAGIRKALEAAGIAVVPLTEMKL
jgi:5-oxoprolinase (ATP-hydrolysing) subunit A